MWPLGHVHGQGLTCAGPTTDAVQDQAVGLTQGESQRGQSWAWALSLASPRTHCQTPPSTWGSKLSQTLAEELSTAWLPSWLLAFLITEQARLGAGSYPGYAASGVWASWRGEASPHHAAATVSPLPSFQSPRGGSGCCQELHQAALVLHWTAPLKRSISGPFLCYLACRVAPALSEAHSSFHTAVTLHWIPSSCIPAPWLERAERAPCQLCFVACVWTAAAGKASKGRENKPLPAFSASFTSLCEAEQKKDLLRCASI